MFIGNRVETVIGYNGKYLSLTVNDGNLYPSDVTGLELLLESNNPIKGQGHCLIYKIISDTFTLRNNGSAYTFYGYIYN